MTEQEHTQDEELPSQEERKPTNIALFLAVVAILIQLAMAAYLYWRFEMQPAQPSASATFDGSVLREWQDSIEQRIGDFQVSGDVVIDNSAFESRLEEVLDRIEAIEAKAGEPLQSVEVIEEKARELEAALQQVKNIQGQAGSAKVAQEMSQLLAFERLKQKVEAGERYMIELEALRRSLPEGMRDASAIQQLSSFSAANIPNNESLKALFKQLREAPDAQGDEAVGLWQSVKQNVSSVVRVRKVGDSHEGTDDDSILARAEALVMKEEFVAATQEFSEASQEVRQRYSGWLRQAQRLQLMHQLLEQIRAMLTVQSLSSEE